MTSGSSGGSRHWRWFVALIISVASLLAQLPPLAAVPVASAASAPRAGELVVLPRSSATAASLTQSLPARYGSDVQAASLGISGRVMLVQVPPGREDEYRARLAADSTIAAVSRNFQVRAEADPLTPNDPQFAQQLGLAAVRAPEAWGDGARATGVTVAVIDSGADYGHPDLAPALLPGCNFVGSSTSTPPSCGPTAAGDDFGHGTHVAGTIAATTNNGVGVAGLAWGASILPLKALDATGSGTWYWIADAIGYATDQPGVRVINMSLGSDPSFPPDLSERALLQTMIDGARAKGIAVVVASGNAGANLDEKPVYPASLNGVITVGAVDQNGARPGWSNYGSAITVAAPGVGILSTGCAYNFAAKACDHVYQTKNGTSMAAPHVAALAALLIARSPTLAPDGIAAVLRATADDLGTPGIDTSFGAGRINAAAAYATPAPTPTPSPTPSPSPSGPPPSFSDVPVGYWAHDPIGTLAQRRITTGCGADDNGNRIYCPERGVTRAEMAVFLTRTLGQDQQAPPATPTFADVPADYWAYQQIEALVKLGITTGCGNGEQGQRLYCPERGVTRAEMAAFLVRARGQAELRPGTPTFADVPANYWAYGWIERLFELRVTTGCGEDARGNVLYCPERGVTRAEMAVLIIRAYP